MGTSCGIRSQIGRRNGVGSLVGKELVDCVVEVKRKSDRIMAIKVMVGSEILNVVSVYAPQMGLSDNVKKQFCEDLDMVIQDILGVKSLS